MKRKSIRLITLGFLFSILLPLTAKAQMEKFEALYIYNICRYIEWPAAFNQNEFVIGIVGNTPMEEALLGIAATKKIQNKEIKVKQISSPNEGTGCNVVFFSKGKENLMSGFLASGNNTLFVSESDRAIKQGADINFFIEANKLKFEMSESNLSKKKMKTSAELKQLASNVY